MIQLGSQLNPQSLRLEQNGQNTTLFYKNHSLAILSNLDSTKFTINDLL